MNADAVLVLVALALASITVAFVVTRLSIRRVQEDAAKVQEEAKELQHQAESVMRGSIPHAIILDECQEADGVDEMIAEVIELSKKKRRRMAREMHKRQKRIERELAE